LKKIYPYGGTSGVPRTDFMMNNGDWKHKMKLWQHIQQQKRSIF